MNIPQTILIGGHEYKINKIPNQPHGGSVDTDTQIIEIDPLRPEDFVAESLLHEIIEAIDVKCNLTVPHVSLTVISEALFAVIRANDLDFRSKE